MARSPARGTDLARLFHHRWSLPVLAMLHERKGARFVVLQRTLDISRDSLRLTLAALRKAGLVRRNPGYGHPLRPEYLLTEKGARLGPASRRFCCAVTSSGLEEVALRKWSMPVLYEIARGKERFCELEAAIAGITPRALAQALKRLHAAGLILRRIRDSYPPRAAHAVSTTGATLTAILAQLTTAGAAADGR